MLYFEQWLAGHYCHCDILSNQWFKHATHSWHLPLTVTNPRTFTTAKDFRRSVLTTQFFTDKTSHWPFLSRSITPTALHAAPFMRLCVVLGEQPGKRAHSFSCYDAATVDNNPACPVKCKINATPGLTHRKVVQESAWWRHRKETQSNAARIIALSICIIGWNELWGPPADCHSDIFYMEIVPSVTQCSTQGHARKMSMWITASVSQALKKKNGRKLSGWKWLTPMQLNQSCIDCLKLWFREALCHVK